MPWHRSPRPLHPARQPRQSRLPRTPARPPAPRWTASPPSSRRALSDPDAHRELGQALLQLVRETLDPSLYASAERALLEADRLRPDDARTLAAIGALQLGRHEFAAALETGRRAVGLSPGLAAAHAVVVDALVELGRYDEAEAAAGRMLAAGDDLGTLARLSYLRELHGDLEAARDLMARAADRPGLAPEHRAFALAILGNLDRWTGDPEAAQADWEAALALVPDHAPSLAGLGRLAVGRGDLEAALDLFGRAAEIVPAPRVRDRPGRGPGGPRRRDVGRGQLRAGERGDPAPALGGGGRRRGPRAVRGRPRRPADGPGARRGRLGRDPHDPRRGRRRLGPAPARARRRGRDLVTPRARPRLARSAAPLPRGRDRGRPGRRAATPGATFAPRWTTDPGFSAAGAADAAALLASLGD